MAQVTLYLDEDVFPTLAVVLRGRGYDVMSAHEVGMRQKSDEDQLRYAISQGRALLTFNTRHFAPLAKAYFDARREHFGIILSARTGLSEMIRLTMNMLNRTTADQLRNVCVWLQSFK
jgi:hypothetical protein